MTIAVALGLRLWGIRHGLPWIYDSDEAAHFVPRAVGHGWHPGYLANPPAYTHLLHVVFWVAPATFLTGRVVVALLGTAAVALLAAAGTRLLDRTAGLAAAALVAVAFLPVFYGHVAVNDVPAMAAVCLALLGAAQVHRRGTALDHALAGAAVGLAAATKYTAGIAVLAVVAASRAPRRLALAGAAAVLAFLVANPNAVLDWDRFHRAITSQSGYSGRHKLGLPGGSGHLFYLHALTWGVGWVPALAALAGAVLLALRDRRRAAVLVLAPVAYLVFMGFHARYFGRWLLPAVPFAALLAGYAVARLPRRLVPLGVAALVAQGLWTSVASDRVVAREDTRTEARAWLLAHVPAGSRVVVEPIVPAAWAARWRRFPLRAKAEGYQRTLAPALLRAYRRGGWCWVVTGSTQEGRALADPGRVPQALAYYAALRREATLRFRARPWSGRPLPFDYDRAFTARPPGYARPGDDVQVRLLRGCAPRIQSAP